MVSPYNMYYRARFVKNQNLEPIWPIMGTFLDLSKTLNSSLSFQVFGIEAKGCFGDLQEHDVVHTR